MRLRRHLLNQHGSTLLEVLVTIIILTFGLLGLAALQAKIRVLDLESFQRGQAVVLINDITERINANRANAASYVTATAIGTGDSEPTTCDSLAEGAAKDICEWSNLLKGSAEKSGANPIGAMIGARGCITAFTVPASLTNTIMGKCQTGIQVDIAWQGTSATVAPAASCGSTQYGANEAFRRVISTRIGTGATSC